MSALKRLLYWLIAGSEGGLNRARILLALRESPANSNQLAERLGINYKTVRHHLDVLERNELIIPSAGKYGKVFFISPLLEREYATFQEILAGIGQNELSEDGLKRGGEQ
jgi:DNA-binding transcriptional ArsR family regulator